MIAHSGASTWRAGVIAAGWGERLRAGTSTLKPLVPVGGRALVDRVLSSLAEAAPLEVVIIVNEHALAVRDHVSAQAWPFALRWIVETTPSSMHSFLRVVETLAEAGDTGPFLISTVDTVAPPGAFAAFAARCEAAADVTLAVVAPPGDDEKPLLVRLGEDGVSVAAIGSGVGPASGARASGPTKRFATAGYYAVRSSVLRFADGARRDGVPALRVFLERVLTSGMRIDAIPVAGGVDVNRAADVQTAEMLLKQGGA